MFTKGKLTLALINSWTIIFFVLAFIFNFLLDYIYPVGEQQYSLLAHSFLLGKLYFLKDYLDKSPMTFYDVVDFKGKLFWPLGPFPAVLLMPFVYVFDNWGGFFKQSYIHFFVSVGVYYLAKKIALKVGYGQVDAKFLAFAFCFASVYQAISFVSWSYYFVQVICVFLVLLALLEFLTNKRHGLIGIIFALLMLSRPSAALGIFFFLFMLFKDKKDKLNLKIRKASSLLAPMLVGLLLFFGYNYARFGNIFDNGYIRAYGNINLTADSDFTNFNGGLFSLKYVKDNFYYYFLKLPKWPYLDVNYPGVSFFVISPIFLYIFRTNFKKDVVKAAFLTIFIILPLLLSYYWTGWRQVGPRYLLDVLPFAYVLLLYSFKKFRLTGFEKTVILISALLDIWLFFTAFEDIQLVA